MTENEKWFGELCNDALIEYHKEKMADCKENAKCSRSHKKKMCEIVGCRFFVTQRISQQIIAAVIAAVMLLIAGCATYMCREKIFGFVVEFYEKYIFLADETGNGKGDADDIEEMYMLSYVPDGFVLVEQFVEPQFVRYVWENNIGNQIVFRQSPKYDSFRDGGLESTEKRMIAGVYLYYSKTLAWDIYIWSEGTNFFRLEINYSISADELAKMIASIKKQ